MNKSLALLVALAPAAVTAALGFAVEIWPRWMTWTLVFKQSRVKLETLKEVLAHSAFYGTVLGGLLGYAKDSVQTYLLVVVWFLGFLWMTVRIAGLVEQLEEAEEAELHIKQADLVQSIVRSEIERANLADLDDSQHLKKAGRSLE